MVWHWNLHTTIELDETYLKPCLSDSSKGNISFNTSAIVSTASPRSVHLFHAAMIIAAP